MNTLTPETDAESFSTVYQGELVYADFARKLERERNDLQNAISGLCEHFNTHAPGATFLAVEILKIEGQRNAMAEILQDISDYTKGLRKHDYSKLAQCERKIAVSAAWQEIEVKIKQALETKP